MEYYKTRFGLTKYLFCATESGDWKWFKKVVAKPYTNTKILIKHLECEVSYLKEFYMTHDRCNLMLNGNKHSCVIIERGCGSLVRECKEQFGEEYVFIQSSDDRLSSWNGVIDNAGELCPYFKLSPYTIFL